MRAHGAVVTICTMAAIMNWKETIMTVRDVKAVQNEQLSTMPTDLKPDAVRDIAGALSALLADVFALY